MSDTADHALSIASRLSQSLGGLSFAAPVEYVYNPLEYAWGVHAAYLGRYAAGRKRVLFLGMNPGPWGMSQTGIPFGDVSSVRDWLGLERAVAKPAVEHPKRPVSGFRCPRGEVSGRRLWGLFAERFGSPERFFHDSIVLNYCPLLFLEASGRNRTPDKLPAVERQPLTDRCDAALLEYLALFRPAYTVGVGAFAERCLSRVVPHSEINAAVVRVLHPSPASPRANRGWAEEATSTLVSAGVWSAQSP